MFHCKLKPVPSFIAACIQLIAAFGNSKTPRCVVSPSSSDDALDCNELKIQSPRAEIYSAFNQYLYNIELAYATELYRVTGRTWTSHSQPELSRNYAIANHVIESVSLVKNKFSFHCNFNSTQNPETQVLFFEFEKIDPSFACILNTYSLGPRSQQELSAVSGTTVFSIVKS